MSDATHNVNLIRIFNSPLQKVWKAWTDAEEVMKWWGPMGFSCPVAKMDVRVGGVSLVCMGAPKEWGGKDMYNSWTYSVIVPLQRLEYIVTFTDADGNKFDPIEVGAPPGIPFEVPHVIIFKEISSNETEVTITEYGYATAEMCNLSKMGMEQCLDKMAASFQ